MFIAFLFIGVFCFYCCVYNGMQGNKVVFAAGTKANKNQDLELVVVSPESFLTTPPKSQVEESIELTSKLTDDITVLSEAETLPDVSEILG